MIRLILIVILFAVPPVIASEWWQSPELLSLMKEQDALTSTTALQPTDEPDASRTRVTRFPAIETRLGIFAPGPSEQSGRFGLGITAGARMPIPFSWGELAVSLDLVYLPTPRDADEERMLIVMAGADHIWNFGSFYAGAGLVLASNSHINDLLLIHGEGGWEIFSGFTLSLGLYAPPAHENNEFMVALRCGYIF
ncbi:hypothetical protein ACFL4W_04780 [Planctomycetota bacterium]